ncbi:MAG: DUF455 family protein [Polyangiales bacterium]
MNVPLAGTMERWAWDYIHAASLEEKFALSPPPSRFELAPPIRRIVAPTRPSMTTTRARFKTPGIAALQSPIRRAQLAHTFLHHELQAAELMCWAILAFPSAPSSFRSGLANIARDEVRHMQLYRAYLGELGHHFGEFPVRDWFWERIPDSVTPAQFVASLGIGFEGANLDHTLRFAEKFRAAGDPRGAALQELVFAEEIPHVRFALHWFRHWVSPTIAASGASSPTGAPDLEFQAWAEHLPSPLSPSLMRGFPMARDGRVRAGFSEHFVNALAESEHAPRAVSLNPDACPDA